MKVTINLRQLTANISCCKENKLQNLLATHKHRGLTTLYSKHGLYHGIGICSSVYIYLFVILLENVRKEVEEGDMGFHIRQKETGFLNWGLIIKENGLL